MKSKKSNIKETYDAHGQRTVFECLTCGQKDILYDEDATCIKGAKFTHTCSLLTYKKEK